MNKAPDQWKTIGELGGEERRAVEEARMMALALAAVLGVQGSTCRDIARAREVLDRACEEVEALLFDPAWGSEGEEIRLTAKAFELEERLRGGLI